MRTYCLHLILLISAFVIPLSESKGKELPTDTLLAHLYDQAVSLMGEGEYDSAQACFDKAFAMEGVTGSPLYPILLNEQATLLFYEGELARSLEMKKSVFALLARSGGLREARQRVQRPGCALSPVQPARFFPLFL